MRTKTVQKVEVYMDDLRCFTIHFFYEIKDAEIYGGVGSIGYAEMKYDMGINADCVASKENYMEHSGINAKILATQLHVPVENVMAIHRDVYQKNTAEDDEECFDNEEFD
jgi:hypothetical protein